MTEGQDLSFIMY